MIDPPADVVRADENQYRRWVDAQDPADLADLVESGAIATDSFPNETPSAPDAPRRPHSKRALVNAILRDRQDAVAFEATRASGDAVVHIVIGLDDVEAAMALLPRRQVEVVTGLDDDGDELTETVDADPEWSLVGDVLTVAGVGEQIVRRALVDARR